MPDPGTALHIAQLDYYCTFGTLQAPAARVSFAAPDPIRFTFTFDAGSTPNPDGSVTVTSDASWFSQSATEAGIASALDQICTAVAALIGLTEAQVQAVVAVKRVWTITPNIQGGGVSSGSTAITNMMPYPQAVPAAAEESGSGSVTSN
jgi:hypothetical protein